MKTQGHFPQLNIFQDATVLTKLTPQQFQAVCPDHTRVQHNQNQNLNGKFVSQIIFYVILR